MNDFGVELAVWPRGSVRATDVDPGRMAWGVTFDVDGHKPIPCRTRG